MNNQSVRVTIVLITIVLIAIVSLIYRGANDDEFIRLMARSADMKPLEVRYREADPLYKLGQSLFYDPVLSGDRSTSCSSCHSIDKGLSDGRQNSNNLELLSTVDASTGDEVKSYRLRNSPDLWNRDHNDTKFLFWDGRLEIVDGERKIFATPFGSGLGDGFENILEVQSTFPMITEQEMKGGANKHSSETLPPPHGNKRNTYAGLTGAVPHAIHVKVVERLVGAGSYQEDWQGRYAAAFKNAFPNIETSDVNITHIGKAIGHFEELAFSSNNSAWDQFLLGDSSALSTEAKLGGKLFLGEALCSGCHSGALLSDFRFHHVGLISEPIDVLGEELDDLGRFAVTGDPQDKFRFRTPPLRNVALSAPYFHDGSTKSLRDAIKRHILISGDEGYFDQGRMRFRAAKMVGLSPLIRRTPRLNDQEVDYLIEFLRSLNGEQAPLSFIIPDEVLSNLQFKR